MAIVIRNRKPGPRPQIARDKSLSPRLRGAETRLRVIEKLTAGLSVARSAQSATLRVRPVREIVADVMARREVDSPAGFVQFHIARPNEAMLVAPSMMMNGNPGARDRLIHPTEELDRRRGYGRPSEAAAAEREIFPAATP